VFIALRDAAEALRTTAQIVRDVQTIATAARNMTALVGAAQGAVRVMRRLDGWSWLKKRCLVVYFDEILTPDMLASIQKRMGGEYLCTCTWGEDLDVEEDKDNKTLVLKEDVSDLTLQHLKEIEQFDFSNAQQFKYMQHVAWVVLGLMVRDPARWLTDAHATSLFRKLFTAAARGVQTDVQAALELCGFSIRNDTIYPASESNPQEHGAVPHYAPSHPSTVGSLAASLVQLHTACPSHKNAEDGEFLLVSQTLRHAVNRMTGGPSAFPF